MVKFQPSKLAMRVRFPLPAPSASALAIRASGLHESNNSTRAREKLSRCLNDSQAATIIEQLAGTVVLNPAIYRASDDTPFHEELHAHGHAARVRFSRSLLRCANFWLQNCASRRNAARINSGASRSEKHAVQRREKLRKNSLGN